MVNTGPVEECDKFRDTRQCVHDSGVICYELKRPCIIMAGFQRLCTLYVPGEKQP